MNAYVYYKMPDRRITRYSPGSGLCVIGLKVPLATPTIRYSPGNTTACALPNLKNAKETLSVVKCIKTQR